MSNTGSTDNFGYGQELKRELSFKDVFVYGMLFMVVIAPCPSMATFPKTAT